MDELRRTSADTPLGPFTVVVGGRGVTMTAFGEEGLPDEVRRDVREDLRGLASIRHEVAAYFGGRLRAFETPTDLSPLGEGFLRRALEVVRTIPYGELWTYGDVAAGGALARCPIELFVPCHRVVRAGPSLGSYGRHDDRRRFLLRLEGALPVVSRRP